MPRRVDVVDGICYIPLSQGKVAICDASDYNLVSPYNWYAQRAKYTYYAGTSILVRGRYRRLDLHRHLMGVYKRGTLVDHIDGDGLNNLRYNLRVCVQCENLRNTKISVDSTTGLKGVSFHKSTGKWQSNIIIHGRQVYLGLFSNVEMAAKAYDTASLKLHGEFGKTNSMLQLV